MIAHLSPESPSHRYDSFPNVQYKTISRLFIFQIVFKNVHLIDFDIKYICRIFTFYNVI